MTELEIERMKNRPYMGMPERELLREIADAREAVASIPRLATVPGTIAFGTVVYDGRSFVKYLKYLEWEYLCRNYSNKV
jgi:hypothetical protein